MYFAKAKKCECWEMKLNGFSILENDEIYETSQLDYLITFFVKMIFQPGRLLIENRY